jgi:ATP-dependent RNA helicase RhlE
MPLLPESDPTPLAPAATTFAALGLLPALAQAAAARGYHQPTPIQAAVLPAVLAGRDVLGLAPTGTGKTAAFLLPLLQATLQAVQAGDVYARPRRLAVVVLAPTRELALQTAAVARGLCEHLALPLKTLVAVGGVSINPQLMALRGGTHVLVATPGRLLDLHQHNALALQHVQTLVLDEADRLLDSGFADEVQRVLALLPPQRQNLLLTATLPDAVRALVASVLREPVVCDVRPAADDAGYASGANPEGGASASPQPPAIHQRAIVVHSTQRTPLLRHLMATQGWHNALVFVATQHASEQVASKLRHAGLPAAALHGQLSQGRRAQVLADFSAGHLAVLVATDLAARGLDVARLAAVVNHDLARSAQDHTHRIGRVGRYQQNVGDSAAVAVSFVLADAPGSEAHFRLIEKRQQQRVPREQVPGFEPPAAAAENDVHASTGPNTDLAPLADTNGGIKGRRPSKKDKLRAAGAGTATAPAPAARVVPAPAARVAPAPAARVAPAPAARVAPAARAVPGPVPVPAAKAAPVPAARAAPRPAVAAAAAGAPPLPSAAPQPVNPDSRSVADVMAEWRARSSIPSKR